MSAKILFWIQVVRFAFRRTTLAVVLKSNNDDRYVSWKPPNNRNLLKTRFVNFSPECGVFFIYPPEPKLRYKNPRPRPKSLRSFIFLPSIIISRGRVPLQTLPRKSLLRLFNRKRVGSSTVIVQSLLCTRCQVSSVFYYYFFF